MKSSLRTSEIPFSYPLFKSCVVSQSLPSSTSLRIFISTLTETVSGVFSRIRWRFRKNLWFLKIPKWQNKLVWKYRRGKLFFSFINNAADTGSYDLKISRDTEVKYVFHSKAFSILSIVFIEVASAPLSPLAISSLAILIISSILSTKFSVNSMS